VDTWQHSFPSVKEGFLYLLFNAKRQLIESDLYKFQTDAYVINNNINKYVRESVLYKAYGDQPETLNFLQETLSTVIGVGNPVIESINNLIDKSIDYLTKTVLADESTLLPEFIIESGLSKYFVSKGVFTMRSSHSISLAESAVVKKMISILNQGGAPPSPFAATNPEAVKYMQAGFPMPRTLLMRLSKRFINSQFIISRFTPR